MRPLFLLLAVLFAQPLSVVHADPREYQLEESLLQQLHPIVWASLQSLYREKYPQFTCERIVSINERVTANRKNEPALPVDAIHGAKYFEITIGICRKNGDYVELDLQNDRKGASYYLVKARITRGSAPQ